MKIDYSLLRDIQRKELESAALVSLEDDFYDSVSAFLSTKKKEALNSNSLLAIKECENIKRIIISIASKREEKLMLTALRSENQVEGLTKEEKAVLKNLVDTISKWRENLNNMWFSENKKVRLLKDVQQYTGADNSSYGPFKVGEVYSLPRQEAEWLLKSRMAEVV